MYYATVVVRRKAHWRTGLAIVAALLVFAVAWIYARRPKGVVTGMAAIDESSVVVQQQSAVADRAARFWVARLDAAAGVRWRTELHGATVPTAPGHGMTVADGLLTVRTQARDETYVRIEAFDLSDGRQAWQSDRLGFDVEAGALSSFAPTAFEAIADRGQLFEAHHDGHRFAVYAFDRGSGTIQWATELARPVFAPQVSEHWLLAFDGRAWIAIDRKDGRQRTRIEVFRALCAADGVLLSVVDGRVAAIDEATLHAELGASLPGGSASGPDVIASSCATHDGRVLLGLGGISGPYHLVALGPDLQPRWTLDLHGTLASMFGSDAQMGRGSFGGEIHRYAPYLITADEVTELLVVDHDEGRIVHRQRLGRAPTSHRTLRTSGTIVVTDEATLLVVDGATGAITTRLHADEPIRAPASAHVAGDTLWIFGAAVDVLDRMRWTRLGPGGLRGPEDPQHRVGLSPMQ